MTNGFSSTTLKRIIAKLTNMFQNLVIRCCFHGLVISLESLEPTSGNPVELLQDFWQMKAGRDEVPNSQGALIIYEGVPTLRSA